MKEGQGQEVETNQGGGSVGKITEMMTFDMCLVMNSMSRPELKKLINVC